MDMTEKKNDLKNLMAESMEKVKEMVDANTIVGEPITTASAAAAGTTAKTRAAPARAAAQACG